MKTVFASSFAALFILAGVPAQASIFGHDGVTITRSDDSRPETATPTKDVQGTSNEEKKPDGDKKPE